VAFRILLVAELLQEELGDHLLACGGGIEAGALVGGKSRQSTPARPSNAFMARFER
jgi:hypothetical protein